jgi:hypothetical protein
MSLSAQIVDKLTGDSAYSFANWPNTNVPTFGAGVYTIWHNDGRFIYVGMSGRGINADTIRRSTPKVYTHAYKAMPVDGGAATSSACRWPTYLFFPHCLRRTWLVSLLVGILWMFLCAGTFMKTYATGS